MAVINGDVVLGDVLVGTADSDTINGFGGNDTITGAGGDDVLIGEAGNDVLTGNAGNDFMAGGTGQDTYVFAPGYGLDTVVELDGGGFDTVKLTGGIIPWQVTLSQDNLNLIIQTAAGDSLTVVGYFDPAFPQAKVEQIVFDDFTVWDATAIAARLSSGNSNVATEGSDTITGAAANDVIYGYGGNDTISTSAGNDQLYGGTGNDALFGNAGSDLLLGEDGNDVLRGGSGNDTLQGGAGNDTYVLALGHNSDQIIENGGFDTVLLDSNYDPTTVRLTRAGNDLVIKSAISTDVAIVQNHFDVALPDAAIEQITFANGTVWNAVDIQNRVVTSNANFATPMGDTLQGTAGAETIAGSDGNDTISGEGGDDNLAGELGDDRLFGNQGNDFISGMDGNDLLAGNVGNDTLLGGAGFDTYLFNIGDGQDEIFDSSVAGPGNRVQFGAGIRREDLRFRQENGDVVIELAGSGDNLRLKDTVLGAAGPRAVDTFQFADGTVANLSDFTAIVGSDQADSLFGTPFNDTVYAQGGDDWVQTFGGKDTIIGGTGNDQLDGGSGNDTYVFALGDGIDTIWDGSGMINGPEPSGTDTVRLTGGYEPALTQLLRSGNDLVILYGPTGDQITVREHFGSYADGNTRGAIERISFADGTIWDATAIDARLASMNNNMPTEGNDTIGGMPWADYINAMGGNDTASGGQGDDQLLGGNGNDRLYGGDGNDVLVGESGNDVLAGGTGNDILDGGAGNDTYLFNLGDGVDRVNEVIVSGEHNRVVFGEGIRYQDLRPSFDPSIGSYVLDIGTNGDRLIAGVAGLQTADTYVFSDGTVATLDALLGYGIYSQGDEFDNYMSGTFGADSLYGNGGMDNLTALEGNDYLGGGQGNDWLSGGAGSDIYFFNVGDGVDFIDDYSVPAVGGLPGDNNRVVFGEGIGIDDLRLRYDGWMTSLDVGSNGDRINFSQFNPLDPMAPRAVSSFELADGTVLSADDLIARGFFLGGSDWSNDYLIGTPLSDRIYGYSGDDTLIGVDGKDVLIGGAGNDQLYGGAGSDTYVFATGDGFDTIWDGAGMPFGDLGYVDVVKLEGGYEPIMTMLQRWGNDLVIVNGQTGDQIVVREHFGSYVDGSTRNAIERISFADGTIWDATAIDARLASMSNMPTEGNDTIGGSPWADYLNGFGGNDTISGGLGDDQIFGIMGNDRLFGGAGNDLLFGEDGNDTLAGGAGSDLLNGWVGNDTYLFNSGDGLDRIEDMPIVPGETNRVVFGDGIRFADLHAHVDYNIGGVTIEVGTKGDGLQLTGATLDPYGPHVIDSFRFSDGTVATYDAVVGFGTYQLGMAFTDWMYGSQNADSLYGNGGDDYLFGDNGNDILAGGQGNDWLSGGQGSDTYVFNRGDGSDFIDEYSSFPSNENRVVFGDGISLSDLRLRSDGVMGRLEIGSSGDALRFAQFFPWDANAPQSVSSFEFADGTTLTTRDLVAAINEAPIVTGSIPDQIVPEDSSYGFVLPDGIFVDPNGGPMLYSATLADGSPLPNWLGFDSQTQTLHGVPQNGDVGMLAIRMTATDSLGAVTYTNFNLSVMNVNDAPVVAQPLANQSASEDSAFLYSVPADAFQDVDAGDSLAFSASLADGSSLPSWLSFNATTRTFSGIPENANVGTLSLRVTVTDTSLANVSSVFNVVVNNTNDAPTVTTQIADQTTNEDAAFSFTIPVDTFSDMDVGDSLAYSATLADGSLLPAWLSFDAATRTFSSSLGDGTAGDFTLRVIATDSTGASVSNDFVLTVADTIATIQNGTASADSLQGTAYMDVLNGLEGDDVLHAGSGNDVLNGDAGSDTLWGEDGSDTLNGGSGAVDVLYGGAGNDTYVFNLGDGQDIIVDTAGDADTLRFGAGITRDMLDISHSTVNPGNVYIDVAGSDGVNLYGWYYSPIYRIENLEFADGTSMTAAEIQAWADNVAPVVASPVATQTATEDAPFNFALPATTFSDANAGDVLSYAATLANGSALPGWLQFDVTTRAFSGTPANDQVGTLALRVSATDSYGKSVFTDFNLIVQNTNDAPVLINVIADQTGAEGSAFSYVIPADTFSDVDVGDSLAYSATLADGSALPAWLSFNAATRTLSGNPADGTAGSYSLRVTTTDSAGSSVFDDFVLTVADTLATVKNGTSNADTLRGTAFMDTLNGFGGNDTLYGYAGNDTLDGGSGSDKMYGGSGDDTYVVNASGDVVTENTNEGSDTIKSSITYTLGSNVENLTLTGSNSINATGNSLDNVLTGNSANNTLTGNAGNDWLDGGAGSDTMRGGTGNDTYVVSTSGDVVTENSNEGTDTVRTSISYTLGNNVENLTLTGAGTASGTGNSLGNVITGNSASNTLTGNGGNDTLQGLGGNDTLKGGTGNDTYIFGRGDGADTISENDSTSGNQDTASLGVNALDVVFARNGSNLVMSLHGGTETLTVQSWYSGSQYQTEVIKAADGSTLLNTQVANLIQAMATFSANHGGISWDQAITQNPNEVQAVLTAYWQPAA